MNFISNYSFNFQQSSKLLNVLIPSVVQAFESLGAGVGLTSVDWQEVHEQHWLSENSWE